MSVSSGDSGNAGGEARDASRSLLLCLSRASLSASAQDRASQLLDGPVDWSQLLLWARLHQVIALVTQNLTKYGLENCVPPQVWTQMRQALHGIRFDLLVQFEQVSRVLAALDSAAVDVLVLKGYGLTDLLYGDLALRPSGDLDLLVRPDQIELACTVLKTIGIPPPPAEAFRFHLENGYHLPLAGAELAGRDLAVELHWDLGPRGLNALNLDEMWQRSQQFTVDGMTALRFSPEDMLLHLALHIRKHRFVGLRWLCDMADLARGFDGRLDWDYVLVNARHAGLETLLFTSLSSCVQLLEAPVPSYVLAWLQPSALRRRVLAMTLPGDPFDVPVAEDKAGWSRLAALEIVLLDKPDAMARELRYRLFPPSEALSGVAGADSSVGQRMSLYASRLAQRTATLLRR